MPVAPVFPTQAQLTKPVLETLAKHGPMRPRDVADAVAEQLNLGPEITEQTKTDCNGHTYLVYQRDVRWTRQNLVIDGLIPKRTYGIWELSDLGHETLSFAQPGIVMCVARTDKGRILFANALDAMSYIKDGITQLIISSFPYPLIDQREYGGWGSDEYIGLFMDHVTAYLPKLTNTGSLVLNLADVYNKGKPTLNTYQEEIVCEMKKKGLHLCGRTIWHSPSKPNTTPWVTKDRCRIANSIETFYWWSPTPKPQANNRNVLTDYSDSFKATLSKGGEIRKNYVGAHQSYPGLRYSVDNGGAIPHNLISCAPESSTSAYVKYCESIGVPFHDARMPQEPLRFHVDFLTEPGQIVGDPMIGSLNLAEICENTDRMYWGCDRSLESLQGGDFRIQNAPGHESYFKYIKKSMFD